MFMSLISGIAAFRLRLIILDERPSSSLVPKVLFPASSSEGPTDVQPEIASKKHKGMINLTIITPLSMENMLPYFSL